MNSRLINSVIRGILISLRINEISELHPETVKWKSGAGSEEVRQSHTIVQTSKLIISIGHIML